MLIFLLTGSKLVPLKLRNFFLTRTSLNQRDSFKIVKIATKLFQAFCALNAAIKASK